jgi:hypothetical protein
MTCNKDYRADGSAIHTVLRSFDGWCICRDCVDVYQKRKAPEKGSEH